MNIIETHVLELIGEDPDSPDVFTEGSDSFEQIQGSINDAIEEICMVTGSYKEEYYLPLKESKSFYRIASTRGEFAWFTDVWLTSVKRRLEQTDVVRLNNFNPRWLENIGTPEAYFPIGTNYIGLWPKPSADTGVLQITMTMIPNRYEDSAGRIKLRKDFQWASAHLAVSEYWASRGDANAAMYHFGEYLSRVGIQSEYPMTNEKLRFAQTEKQPWPASTR